MPSPHHVRLGLASIESRFDHNSEALLLFRCQMGRTDNSCLCFALHIGMLLLIMWDEWTEIHRANFDHAVGLDLPVRLLHLLIVRYSDYVR